MRDGIPNTAVESHTEYEAGTHRVKPHDPNWSREYEAKRDADEVIAAAYHDGEPGQTPRTFIESVYYTISRL